MPRSPPSFFIYHCGDMDTRGDSYRLFSMPRSPSPYTISIMQLLGLKPITFPLTMWDMHIYHFTIIHNNIITCLLHTSSLIWNISYIAFPWFKSTQLESHNHMRYIYQFISYQYSCFSYSIIHSIIILSFIYIDSTRKHIRVFTHQFITSEPLTSLSRVGSSRQHHSIHLAFNHLHNSITT